MPRQGKKALLNRLFSMIGLVVGGGILAYLVVYTSRTVDLRELFSSVRPGWLLGAALCVPACELVDALIFYGMGRRLGCPVRLLGCLDVTFIGELYYRLGPAGAPVQLKLMLDAGMSGPAAASIYTWKAVANTMAYTGYAVAALGLKLLIQKQALGWAGWCAAALVLGYVAICGAVAYLAARPEPALHTAARLLRWLSRRIKRLDGRTGALMAKLREFCTLLKALHGDRKLLAGLLLGMILELGLLFSIPVFLFYGLGRSGHTAADLLLTQCLVMVLSRVILLPGNAGGAEGSFYLFMEPVFQSALPVALLLWRGAAFVEVLLLGGVWSVVRFARTAWRPTAKETTQT